MIRVMAAILIVWSLLLLASCFDPAPGEISVRCFRNGRPKGCAVAVFNSDGAQIQLIPTDMNGLKYIELPPGKYTLKFQDNDGNPYPAVKVVNLGADESLVLDVDLDEAPASTE